MAVVSLGTNIASLKATRQLDQASRSNGVSAQRLASGQRINSAGDDAAGLAIADSLNAKVRVYSAAIRNLNDGISAISIAEGAVSSLSTIVTRIMELAEQSANGIYSDDQRQALDREAQALRQEYARVAASTSFNGTDLLMGEGTFSVQGGIGDSAVTLVDMPDLSLGLGFDYLAGDGTFGTVTTFASNGVSGGPNTIGDFDGDGDNDVAAPIPGNAIIGGFHVFTNQNGQLVLTGGAG